MLSLAFMIEICLMPVVNNVENFSSLIIFSETEHIRVKGIQVWLEVTFCYVLVSIFICSPLTYSSQELLGQS